MDKYLKKLLALLLICALLLPTALAATYTDKDTVKKVQQALNDAGYNCGTPDGIAGKNTAAAITQYQTDKGLEVTGTIDDALLEAMGLSTADQAEEADQPEAANGAAESQEGDVNLHDPQTLATYYNLSLLAELAELGVDIENEDVGQDAYTIKKIENVIYYVFKSDAFKINYTPEDEELDIYFAQEDLKELSFMDYAALQAFLFTVHSFFEGSPEDWQAVMAYLGDAPDRDGTVSIEDKELNYTGNTYKLYGWGYYYDAERSDNYGEDKKLRGDDVPAMPDELAEKTGGIPDKIDEQWARYDIIEDLMDRDSGNTSRGSTRVVKEKDGTYTVTIKMMDDQFRYYKWFGHYDESLNLIEKSYLEY